MLPSPRFVFRRISPGTVPACNTSAGTAPYRSAGIRGCVSVQLRDRSRSAIRVNGYHGEVSNRA